MKKFLLGSALAISALSVVIPTQNAIAQEVVTLNTEAMGDGLNWLAKRVYSIEAGTLAYEMEQDGVTTREYVAVFNAEGAIVQNYDLVQSKTGLDKAKRGAGFQVLPYKLSLTSDGRKLISVGLISFKNMNEAYNTIISPENSTRKDGKYKAGIWRVINTIDLLVYEYDDSLGLNNTKRKSFTFAKIEAKLDLLNASTPGHFLALVGRASISSEEQEIYLNSGDTILINRFSEDAADGQYGTAKRYSLGLEYGLPINERNKINASILMDGGVTTGYKELEIKDPVTNLDINEKATRSYMYLTPSIKYKGRLGDKVDLQVDLFGNIPLKDDYGRKSLNIDLTGSHARPIVGAGGKLKF